MRASRWLTWLLRHGAAQEGVGLSEAGWANVDDVLLAAWERGLDLDEGQLADIVAADDKGRFELADRRIRAVYGHSLAVGHVGEAATPPAVLYHGTTATTLDRILAQGLRPQGRRHVHLSEQRRDAWRVARRWRGRPALLRVDAARMHADDAVLYRSGAGVWLADQVPARYLQVEERPLP